MTKSLQIKCNLCDILKHQLNEAYKLNQSIKSESINLKMLYNNLHNTLIETIKENAHLKEILIDEMKRINPRPEIYNFGKDKNP